MHDASQAGGTFLDTAASYPNGESESIVADLLAAGRDHFTLATRFSSASGTHRGVLDTGDSRQNMVRAVEASLRRLRTDRIDLYWGRQCRPAEALRGSLGRRGRKSVAGPARQ